MSKRELVNSLREEILTVAGQHGLEDVRIFGSVARGDDDGESDVDFFARRIPGSDPFLVLGAKDVLSELMGCQADVLLDSSGMRPRLRRRIEADLQPL